jgi:hypothetical protein
MNRKAGTANQSENPRRRSMRRRIVALAAAFAVLFGSFPTNAYPLHSGEYAFWPEMPEASQVLNDMKGGNDLDTAARQHAALVLLIALVNVSADGSGQIPWPARERELNSAYFGALPDGNGHRDEMMAASLRLQADPSFVQPFLRRYFSEAALREIEPMVSSFEAGAKNRINREANSQNQPGASPDGSTASPVESFNVGSLLKAPRGPAPDKPWLTVAAVSVFATLLLLVPLLPLRRFVGMHAPIEKDVSENTKRSKSPGGTDNGGAGIQPVDAPSPGNRGDFGPLAANILLKVESLARPLDKDELSIHSGAQETLPVRLVVQHAATFSSEKTSGKGPLPSNVEALDSETTLNRVLHERLEAAQQQAGARIDGWANTATGDYRNKLTPEWCMQSLSPVGVESECGLCHGRKRLVCSNCNGNRQIPCSGCGGRGKVSCHVCHGSQSVNCGSCGGRGYHEKSQPMLTVEDRAKTMSQQNYVTVRVPCGSCGGRGTNSCNACVGGTVNCSGCGGRGQIGCPRCGATGYVPCGHCDATGRVYCRGVIKCVVDRTERVGVTSHNPEDQETFIKRVAFDWIGQLASDTGGVVYESGGRDQFQLTHCFKASVKMESAEAKAGGQSLLIRAYGPWREVYNYHNLVGSLLETDLARLEMCVRPFSLFRSQERSTLIQNTNRFLASEVNARIVESSTPQTKADRRADNAPALEPDRASDVVDEEYIRRAGAALNKAMAKLYGRIMLPMLPGVTAVMTLLFLFGRENFFWSGTIGARIMALMLLGMMFWVGVEQLAKYKLKLVLDPRYFTRLKKQFTKRRVWYRLVMLAIFPFAWYLSLLMVCWILHIRLGTPFDWLPDDGAQFWQ